MPEQSHPPYSPNNYQPRVLDRWLDINSQNGPLSRVQMYFTLPTFSVGVTWRGYSDIVAAFNFESPNSFSLTVSGPTANQPNTVRYTVPTNPNYTLCISWHDSEGNMYRYSLWRADGDVIYFNLPVYTGQLIKKNCRFEVWSTLASPATNTAATNFYSSVQGNIDYRFGTDGQLAVSDGLVTNFNAANIIPPSPPVVATDWWVGSAIIHAGTTFFTWPPSAGTGNIAVTFGSVTVDTAPPLSLVTTVGQITATLSSNVTAIKNFYAILNTSVVNSGFVFINNGAVQEINMLFTIVGGVFTMSAVSGAHNGSCPAIQGQIIGVGLTVAGSQGTFTTYNNLGVVTGTFTVTLASATIATIECQLIDNLYEVIQLANAFDFPSYIHANYAGIPLPLTFPANSVSANN